VACVQLGGVTIHPSDTSVEFSPSLADALLSERLASASAEKAAAEQAAVVQSANASNESPHDELTTKPASVQDWLKEGERRVYDCVFTLSITLGTRHGGAQQPHCAHLLLYGYRS
jgi:hypothetical protein